jgi:hypothetical protein
VNKTAINGIPSVDGLSDPSAGVHFKIPGEAKTIACFLIPPVRLRSHVCRQNPTSMPVLSGIGLMMTLLLFSTLTGVRYRDIAYPLKMSLGAVSLSLARSLARIARCA